MRSSKRGIEPMRTGTPALLPNDANHSTSVRADRHGVPLGWAGSAQHARRVHPSSDPNTSTLGRVGGRFAFLKGRLGTCKKRSFICPAFLGGPERPLSRADDRAQVAQGHEAAPVAPELCRCAAACVSLTTRSVGSLTSTAVAVTSAAASSALRSIFPRIERTHPMI